MLMHFSPYSTTHRRSPTRLLERNETRRVGGTDTRPTVLDGPVRNAELAKVVADHLWLDLDLVELLAAVDADDGADHFGDDDHVTQMRLDEVGLLVGLGLLLSLAELLDEAHGLAGTRVDDIAEVLAGQVEQLIEVNAAVGKLSECSLSLDLGSLFGVVLVGHDCGCCPPC